MNASARSLLPYLGRRWHALGGAAAATVVSVAAALAVPWPLKLVIDRLFEEGDTAPFELTSGDYRFLAFMAAAVVGIVLLDATATYLSTVWLNRAAEEIVHELRTDTYDHLHRLSLAYHDRTKKGDLVTRVTSDVTEVGRLFSETLGSLVSAGLLLVGMLVVTLVMDPLLSLAVVGLVPFLAAMTVFSRRTVGRLSREQRRDEGEIASLATEALAGVETVKAFGTEGFEKGRIADRSARRQKTAVRVSRVEARFGGAVDVLGAIGTALVLVFGVFRVSRGALTPGDLVVFATYAQRTYRPLRDIVKNLTKAARAMARAERIAEVLSVDEVLPADPAATAPAPRAEGHVRLRGATFGYAAGRDVVKGVDLDVPAGTRIALVGRSGAGKSTLCSLVARFHDVREGEVTVDGRDVRSLPLAWLRDQIGVLLQDSLLFTGTVAENIAYGLDATPEEIVAAATAAGADGFIRDLPEGYDTPLGHRGVGLSGGQRQRLGIARVLLRNPPILILDEPTTGLDAESESAVLDGLATLMHGRTSIIVTHSGLLAHTADRVVVMEDGHVVQDGSPAELMDTPGPFRRMELERSMASRRRRTAPRDVELPQMRWMLDPGAMEPVLARTLGEGSPPIDDLRVAYARYRPGRRLTVRYVATVAGREHDAVALCMAGKDLAKRVRREANVLMARAVNGRSPAATPLSYDADVDALLQWLPLDLALPALAEPPELLAQRLGMPGVRGEPEVLSYRPRSRARLAFGDAVLTAYGSPARLATALHAARVAADHGLPVPPVTASLPNLRLLARPRVDGEPMPATPEWARRAGELARRLHELPVTDLPALGRVARLDHAAEAARAAAAASPLVGPPAEALLRRLADTAPPGERLVASFGAFGAGRLLVGRDGGLTVTDADAMAMASPALDIAAFAARMVHGPEDLARAGEVLDALCAGYGSRPAALEWHLALEIARRLEEPFTLQHDDWPHRTRALIDAATKVLA